MRPTLAPGDRLLVETDAPYLAPEPHRGRPNEPAYVARTAQVLAETLGMTPEALARLTTANFFALFDKAARAPEPGADAPGAGALSEAPIA